MAKKRKPKQQPFKKRMRIVLLRHIWRPLHKTVQLSTGRYLWDPVSRTTPNPGIQDPAGFFVDLDACVACGVCGSEAPDFFGFVDNSYESHVLRQPETDDEMDVVRGALEVCCVDAIFYGGDDLRAKLIVDAVTPENGRPQFTFLGSLARRFMKRRSPNAK